MPRDDAIIFCDIVGKLTVLRITVTSADVPASTVRDRRQAVRLDGRDHSRLPAEAFREPVRSMRRTVTSAWLVTAMH